MEKGKHAKQKYQVVEIYTVLLFVAFIFMSIGYAQISDIDMIISGQATATAQDGVFIYDVGEAVAGGGAGSGTGGNAAESTVNTYFSTNLGTTVVLGDSSDSTISYNVSLYNNSNDKYVFVGVEEPVVYNNLNGDKNEYITYSLSENMKAGETIIGYGANDKNLDFTVTFKYKDGDVPNEVADKVLNSLLNIRFRLLPMVSLNGGVETQVVDSSVYAIYSSVIPYEYQFTVENALSGSYNKVPMKYTLSVDSEIVLPNGIDESPLIVEIDNDDNASNSAAVSDIDIAGDGITSPLHNYILRVKWNEDAAYNSAKYAGKTFTYKVNFVGTPTVETAKYLGYTHNKSFVVNITTAPLNFNVSPATADIFMESDGKASIALGITNSSDVNYDTEYSVKVVDNTKFTSSIDSTPITDSGIPRTLQGGADKNDNFIIDFAADVNDINRKEVVNVVLDLKSPYTKEIVIPVNIRSIVMSAKNEKDGSVAIGDEAQVTNGNVNLTIKCDGTYLDSSNNRNLQYSVGENNWQTIATSEISNVNTTNAEVTKEISVNGNVYARYFDGTNGYGTTQIAIDNIDKVSPNAFNVSQDEVTTYSVKVSGSTTDNGSDGTAAKYVGVSGYQYRIKKEDGTVLKAWTPETETTETSYTFVSNTSNNLEIKQGTKYIVSMRAVDLAGNYSEEASVEVITDTVADSEAKIGTRASTQAPTPDPVTVWFTDNSGKEDLILKYQIGSTSDNGWKDYNEVTGVSVPTNCVVNARLFDVVGQSSNTTATITVGNIDKLAPNKPTIEASNVEQTTLTLIASTTDQAQTTDYACSGIARYDFYINGELKKSIPSTEVTNGTAVWNATEADGITAGTPYTAKVVVYDAAGNSNTSDEIEFTTKTVGLKLAAVATRGDFVDYDAGTWNKSTDETLITKSGGSVTWNSTIPGYNQGTQGQFLGFVDGGDRNKNSTPYSTSYTPFYEGWRVWDINGDIVTLISAGHTETYYHDYGKANESQTILQNRDCTMYANGHSYVITEGTYKPHFLTKAELDTWYQVNIDSNYSDTYDVPSFPTATDMPMITLVENGSYWWLASAYNSLNLNYVNPYKRGIRHLNDYAYRCACPSFS